MQTTLQTILDKTIEKWWKPWGIEKKTKISIKFNLIFLDEKIIERADESRWRNCVGKYSFNDLFSVESWLLQAVTWKVNRQEFIGTFPDNSLSDWVLIRDIDYIAESKDWQYHTMIMSIMTQDEKIKYFIKNVE